MLFLLFNGRLGKHAVYLKPWFPVRGCIEELTRFSCRGLVFLVWWLVCSMFYFFYRNSWIQVKSNRLQ